MQVASTVGFSLGYPVDIEPGTSAHEVNTLQAFGSMVFANPLKWGHPAGAVVSQAHSVPAKAGAAAAPAISAKLAVIAPVVAAGAGCNLAVVTACVQAGNLSLTQCKVIKDNAIAKTQCCSGAALLESCIVTSGSDCGSPEAAAVTAALAQDKAYRDYLTSTKGFECSKSVSTAQPTTTTVPLMSSGGTSLDSGSGRSAISGSAKGSMMWQWVLLVLCFCCCLAGIGGGGAYAAMSGKKKSNTKKRGRDFDDEQPPPSEQQMPPIQEPPPMEEKTTLTEDAQAGDTKISVADQRGQKVEENQTLGFRRGQMVEIDPGTAVQEVNTIKDFGSLILENPLMYPHKKGARVIPGEQAANFSEFTRRSARSVPQAPIPEPPPMYPIPEVEPLLFGPTPALFPMAYEPEPTYTYTVAAPQQSYTYAAPATTSYTQYAAPQTSYSYVPEVAAPQYTTTYDAPAYGNTTYSTPAYATASNYTAGAGNYSSYAGAYSGGSVI